MLQHPPLEHLEPGRRLDTELVVEHAAKRLVALQRLYVASGPVEREHQLSAQTLAVRVAPDERVELADELGVLPERKVRLDSLFQTGELQFFEPRRFMLREGLFELPEGRAAPQRERLPQPGRGLSRLAPLKRCAPERVELFEPEQVERMAVEREQIARCPRAQ